MLLPVGLFFMERLVFSERAAKIFEKEMSIYVT